MTYLKRDGAVSFTLWLALLTAFLFFLRIQSTILISTIYFEEQPVHHFFYWLLHTPGELFACVFPIGLVIFVVRILWRHSLKIKTTTWYALSFVIIATLVSCLWLVIIFFSTDGLFSGHISSVNLMGRTYQFGYFSTLGKGGYILAECDSFGLICDVAYIAIAEEYMERGFEDIELIVHPYSRLEALILQLDGETVYAAPLYSW